MARRARSIVNGYAQVWPRSVFDIKAAGKLAQDVREALGDPGVYVLYREDQPYWTVTNERPGCVRGASRNRRWARVDQS